MRPPDLRNRRATSARSSISDESANDRSVRSTSRSRRAASARERAVLRSDCVARSSSPEHVRIVGSSLKVTIRPTYPKQRGLHSVGMSTHPELEEVEDALTNVIDPELGLDFVELGLIYGIEIDGGHVHVTFTLTTPACPIGPQVTEQIEEFVSELDGVESVESTMIFTPPWTPDKMSEDAKFALGY
jgi:metal-sulfur cluster biosynthetic enzyme